MRYYLFLIFFIYASTAFCQDVIGGSGLGSSISPNAAASVSYLCDTLSQDQVKLVFNGKKTKCYYWDDEWIPRGNCLGLDVCDNTLPVIPCEFCCSTRINNGRGGIDDPNNSNFQSLGYSSPTFSGLIQLLESNGYIVTITPINLGVATLEICGTEASDFSYETSNGEVVAEMDCIESDENALLIIGKNDDRRDSLLLGLGRECFLTDICMLCWGESKQSNETVSCPALVNKDTKEITILDYITDDQGDISCVEKDMTDISYKIIKCDECFQHISTITSRFENIDLITFCDGTEHRPTSSFDLKDYGTSQGYVEYINDNGLNVYIIRNRCIANIYRIVNGVQVLLTDGIHPIKQYGDCCDCNITTTETKECYYNGNSALIQFQSNGTFNYTPIPNSLGLPPTVHGDIDLLSCRDDCKTTTDVYCSTTTDSDQNIDIGDELIVTIETCKTDSFRVVSARHLNDLSVSIDMSDIGFEICKFCCDSTNIELRCQQTDDIVVNRPLSTINWGYEDIPNSFTLSGDFEVCFDITYCDNPSPQMFGVSYVNTTPSYISINCAFYMYKRTNVPNFRIYTFELGANQGLWVNQAGLLNQTFCIRRFGTTIQYIYGGVVIDQKTGVSIADMIIDNSFYSRPTGYWSQGEITIGNIEVCEIEELLPFSGRAANRVSIDRAFPPLLILEGMTVEEISDLSRVELSSLAKILGIDGIDVEGIHKAFNELK